MKRIISFILVVCLILGLLAGISISALAAPASYDITGIDAPALGNTLDTTGITGLPQGYTAEVTWEQYDYAEDCFHLLDAPTVATTGVYLLTIVAQTEGQATVNDETLASITINGEAPDNYDVFERDEEFISWFFLTKVYIIGDITLIDTITIDALPAVEAGIATDFSGIVLPANAPYHLAENTIWYAGDEEVGAVLEDGKLYELWVYLLPNEGYWFHPMARISAPMEYCYLSISPNGYVDVDFAYDLRPIVHQLSVDITASAEKGQTVSAPTITFPSGAEFFDLYHWSVDGYEGYEDVALGDTFGYGHYSLFVTISSDNNTIFADDLQIILNGQDLDDWEDAELWSMDNDYVVIRQSYVVAPENGFVYDLSLSGAPTEIEPGQTITVPELEVEHGNATIANIQWLDAQRNPVTGTFQDGKLYYLAISMTADEGYALLSGDYVEIIDEEDYYHYPNMEADVDGNAVIYMEYDLSPALDKLNVLVTEPQIGAVPAEPTVPTGAHFTIETYWWHEMSTGDEIEKFENGRKYMLYVVVTLDEGYRLAEDAELTINGKEVFGYDSDGREALLYSAFSFMDPIDRVDITIPQPQLGGTADMAGIKAPENAKYQLITEYSAWYGEDSEFTGTFGKDKYHLQFSVIPAEKYEFTKDTVIYINGQPYDDAYIYEDGLYIDINYTVNFRDVISKVQLPALPTVSLGDTAEPIELELPDGTHYIVDAIWTIYTGDFSAEPFEGVFEDETAYYLTLSLYALSGYEFAENLTITVDGQTYAGLKIQGDKYLYLAKLYSFGLNVIDTVEITVDAPADGEKPAAPTAAEDAPYAVLDYSWNVGKTADLYDTESMDKKATFAAGNYYWLYCGIQADEGYIFSDTVTVLINGKEAQSLEFLGLPIAMGNVSIACAEFGLLQASAQKPVTPPTGDTVPVVALIVLAVLAMAGLAVVIVSKKKFA